MTKQRATGPIVVKVGGSLFAHPRLGPRLATYLDSISSNPIVIVPGGGAAANVVRKWDRDQELGDAAAHELALKAMTLNGYFLGELLRLARGRECSSVSGRISDWPAIWKAGHAVIADAAALMQDVDSAVSRLPRSWDITSDTIAARIALDVHASRLVLLKSAPFPSDASWEVAADRGVVDSGFCRFSNCLSIEWIDFRD
jgi:aspartokinase-like uncharacterized kinase